MPTDRAGAYCLFTEPFQRRMPLINQQSTVRLKRKEKKIVKQQKIILGLKRVYSYYSIFERAGDAKTGRDTDTVSVARCDGGMASQSEHPGHY